MIDKNLLLSILFGLAALYLIIGIWASKKVKTLKSYFLADRNLGTFKLTLTLVATQLGSGMLLGTSQRAYQIGFWGILYTIGMSLGFIILGCGLAARMRSLNIATTAEIFETHYGSVRLKQFASILSIATLWGILVAQIVASKSIFLSLGLDDPYILTAFWSFLIFYTMIGGLGSVVIIDAIQVIFIISVFTYIAIKAIPFSASKLSNYAALSKIQHDYFPQNINLQDLLPTLFMPTLFALIEQDLAQRFFAAKNQVTATISAFSASIILIVFSCIPLFFGIFAKVKHVTVPFGADPLLPVIAKSSGHLFFVLAICAVIAAITSTADSLLSAISSNIVQDFQNYLPMGKRKLFFSRSISFITGALALLASFFIQADIISVLVSSYRISVVCLFIPTVIAYFAKDLSAQTAWTSILLGIIGLIWTTLYIQTPILKDIIPLSCSLIGYIGSYFFILQHKKSFS